MGERFRLRKDFDVSGFPPHAQAMLKGLKKYGMFVADNGSDWLMSIAPDRRLQGLETPAPREGIGLRGGGDRRAVGGGRTRRPRDEALRDRLRRARRELARPAQARYAARAPRARARRLLRPRPRARRSAIATRFGFARSYTDPWAMLDAERPDAVVLVVPEDRLRHGGADAGAGVSAAPGEAARAGTPQEVDEDMWHRLATLPPRQRAVLVLRYYEDLIGTRDGGSALRCSVAAVKSLTAWQRNRAPRRNSEGEDA